MNEKAKKAERHLRKRLKREHEMYDPDRKITDIKLTDIKPVEDNRFVFEVNYESALWPDRFEVAVYSKSFRVWRF